ncbi:MAG: DUF692 family protein [Bryobacteraceae bacterium]
MEPGAERDRVGLGWRPQLAAGIFANLDRIDVVEVIADDYLPAARKGIDALRTLRAQTPVLLHSIGLGPGSTARVEQRRVDALAKLIEAVEPESWSEHLAFVRGGGIEIGHLCAPPRNAWTVEGTAENLDRMRRGVGVTPMVENIATLVDPPGSDLGESVWLSAVMAATESPLLLDLHNVVTNARNLGYEAVEFLEAIPLDRVRVIHISGGRFLGGEGGPILDDHLHDPPEPVYQLLEEVGRRARQPLTVILERDGRFPAMSELLAQLDRARASLRAGRERGA